MSVELPNFTCIIIGDGRTGKTSLLRKLSSKVTDELSRHMHGHHRVLFSTNLGALTFDIRDTRDQEVKRGSLRDAFFHNADCAVILFDATSPVTYENVFYWFRRVRALAGAIPTVLCANKIDIGTRRVMDDRVQLDWSSRMKCFEISVHDEESICAPFLHLAQRLLRGANVEGDLTEIAKIESETSINLEELHRYLDDTSEKFE